MENKSPDPSRRSRLFPWLARGLWLACLGLLGWQLWLCWPVLANPDMVGDDYRQLLFWTPAFKDPTLFRNDFLAQYSRDFSTCGVAALYWTAVRAGLDPVFFSKLLGLALYLALLAGVARIGRVVARRTAPLACPLLMLMVMLHNNYFCYHCQGGLPRSFILPLQIWILDGLLRRRVFRQALPLSLVAAFFHPQSFLIAAGAIALLLALEWLGAWRRAHFTVARRARLARRTLAFAGLAALGLVPLLISARHAQAAYGRTYRASEIRKMPDYEPGGRWPQERPLSLVQDLEAELYHAYFEKLLGLHPGFYKFLIRSHWAYLLVYGFAELGLPLLFLRRRRLVYALRPVLLLALASLAGWGLAHLLLLKLYFPNRFLRPAVLFAALVINAALLADLTRPGRRLAWRCAGGLALALFLLTFPTFFVPSSMMECLDLGGYRPLAGFMRTLPPDALFAAQPQQDADNLMTLSRRRFYVTFETAHPLYKKYYEEVRQRTYLTLAALYPVAGDSDVRALAARGVRYMVVQKHILYGILSGKSLDTLCYLPYGKWLAKRLKDPAIRRRVVDYWLLKRGPSRIYEDQTYIVFSIGAV